MDGSRTATTRREIIDAARILFGQQGVDQTTLQDIAARLEVSEKAIGAHFPSLDDLLEAVWSE